MQVLDGAVVARLLDMASCIRVVEDAFRARGEGRRTPSAMLGLELSDGSIHAKLASLDGARGYVAAKINANFPSNPRERNLPTVQGVLVLFDGANGVPLAVMDSAAITTIRTAATTAVAARWLARSNAASVTFVGCGVQGFAHLSALGHVRTIERIFAVDPRREAAVALCRAAEDAGISATIPSSLGDATHASDIVVTSTPSRQPILGVGDVRPGTFVAAVGADNEHKQEIDPELLRMALVVVDDRDQCARYGDLHHALAAGVIRVEDVHASLDEIVAGTRRARSDEAQIIVFDSTGLPLEDVAAARLGYDAWRADAALDFENGTAPRATDDTDTP